MASPVSQDELPRIGTGERARQLALFPEAIARQVDVFRSRQCEALVVSAGPYSGKRLIKAIPPYLKWPIWRAKPSRTTGTPSSFGQLNARAPGTTTREMVIKRFFNLVGVPRAIGEVSYLRGELGAQDRRVSAALSDHAVRTARDAALGGYRISVKDLFDLLGIARASGKNRSDIPASLWRMSGTVIHLNALDGLSGSWGTNAFALLPRVVVSKRGRECDVLYDFPEPANALIASGAVCTIDMYRLRGMRSPLAESLYLLLYDVAQWATSLTQVSYPVAELAERLGIAVPSFEAKGKSYQHWTYVAKLIGAAVEEALKVAHFLRDYRIEGKGAGMTYHFFFASTATRKGHLPPRPTTPSTDP